MNIKNVYGFWNIYFNFEQWKIASNPTYNYKRIKNLPIVIRSKRGLKERLDTLKKVNTANLKTELFNKDKYHWGLVNGIIYAIAILEGKDAREVEYVKVTTKAKIIKPKKPKSNIILPR